MNVYNKKARVRVCVHKTCCMRGSEKIYEALCAGLGNEADVSKISDCFRFCKSGPNVSVNGNILQGMTLGNAERRVKREIKHPSKKTDGMGSRSIDELDSVLDDLFL